MRNPHSRSLSAVTRVTASLFVLGALAACAGVKAGEAPDGSIPGGMTITAAQIERTGARDALEVIERWHHYLYVRRDSHGDAERITMRGATSLIVDAHVLVVIDGVPSADPIVALEAITAPTIRSIQILSSREATPWFGTSAGNGVIAVWTSSRTRS
ncbi:MAG: TonB-dependent receptor plug domain-containing protein [Longimicrobiales bacterium]|nr:TonB-dependent receptor plug domain-containing protein [Longimicrobiales bacterium]